MTVYRSCTEIWEDNGVFLLEYTFTALIGLDIRSASSRIILKGWYVSDLCYYCMAGELKMSISLCIVGLDRLPDTTWWTIAFFCKGRFGN